MAPYAPRGGGILNKGRSVVPQAPSGQWWADDYQQGLGGVQDQINAGAIPWDQNQGLGNIGYHAPGQGPGGGAKGRWITPDYSGILGSFTADSRARFGAGLKAKQAQRLSGARSIINRLGIRDVGGMLEKLKAYGLTQADLQGAADNPWSELKALEQQGKQAWAGTVADRAARGGYRSGGTIGSRQRLDQDLLRNEAMLTQDALEGLSQGQQGLLDWELQARDQMEQAIAQQQAALAAAYQPYWDPGE